MDRPSDFEMKLLRSLWRHGRSSAREVHEATQPETNWSYSSTRKVLDRMADKGLVAVASVHGMKTFVAAEPKLKTVARLIRGFARDILELDAPPPAATFVGGGLITPDEVEELEALLQELDDDAAEDDA